MNTLYRGYHCSATGKVFIRTNGRLFSWSHRRSETPLSNAMYYIRILAEYSAKHGKMWEPSYVTTAMHESSRLVITVSLPDTPLESDNGQ